jgi:hypothetical protein
VAKLLRLLASIKFSNPDHRECIEDLMAVEKWNAHMPSMILSGKLLTRSAKTLQTSEFLGQFSSIF